MDMPPSVVFLSYCVQVAECREAAEGLQALLAQGIFVDAAAAPSEAVAELHQLTQNISELQVGQGTEYFAWCWAGKRLPAGATDLAAAT